MFDDQLLKWKFNRGSDEALTLINRSSRRMDDPEPFYSVHPPRYCRRT